jgi:hypothetical protein
VLQQSMQQAGWPMLHRQPFDGERRSVFLFEKASGEAESARRLRQMQQPSQRLRGQNR